MRGIARKTPLAVVGLAAAALAVPSVATAAFPTDAGRILLTDGDGVSTSIWADGTHGKNETNFPPMAKVDSWHASGSKAIYTDGGADAFVALDNGLPFNVNAAGAKKTEPTSRPVAGAAIAPDGDRAVLATDEGVVIVGGQSPESIHPAPAGRIAWSAQSNAGTIVWDGFAVQADPGNGGGIPGGDLADPFTNQDGSGGGIWMSREGASAVEVVTDTTATDPSIAQDGSLIAWAQDGPTGGTDIYYLDPTEQNPTPHLLANSTSGNDNMPAVSPDGTQIAFVAGDQPNQVLKIANLNGAPGTNAKTLTNGITGVAWQPASKPTAGAIGVTGTADVGQMLSANPLTAPSGTAPFVDTFAWEACDDLPADGPDPTCAQVGVGSFYTVKESDRGKRMRLVLTTRNAAGSDKSYSARTAVVPGGNPAPVDSTAPDPSSFTGFPALSDPDTTPTFSWVGSEPGGRFECQIVGDLKGAVIPPDAPATTDWEACTSPFTTPELAEGVHEFRVRHFDAANNVQGYDAFEWTVAAAPPAPDTTGPLQPTFTVTPAKLDNDPTPSFEWTGAEAGGKFQCRIWSGLLDTDYSTWTDCTSPFTAPELTDGYWTIGVRQVDDAGNPGDVRYFEYELDTQGPAEQILLETPFLNTPFPTATFKFNKSDEKNTLECRVDAPADEVAGGWKPCTSPVVLPDLPNGKHKFEVREVDPAGNAGVAGVWNWIVNAPVVEQPKPEEPVKEEPKPEVKPETPKAETPAVPTPAVPTPAVEAPKTESPKPATVVVPAPAAKPATAKAPALVATIGGTKTGAQVGANGGTSSAATIEVAKESVGVGCSITGTVLKSCKVDLYAPKASGARARAAASEQVLVGTGTYENVKGSSKMDVKIELNATGKAMLRSNPGGLKVTVKISGQPVSGAPLKATGVAKLVTDRASATVGGFAVNSAVLTRASKAQLRALAKFGKAATVRCVGHTDGSTNDESYLKGLGERRAKAVCGYLAKYGVKAGKRTLVSKADTVPASTNTTKAGRAKNRRVVVTLVR